MKRFTCEDAKAIDLVEYLASLNYYPAKRPAGDNYYYLSPLRKEREPSFHVDRKKQVWFDHGTGKGGDLIEFGKLYFNCTTSELLEKLSKYQTPIFFSFGSPASGRILVAANLFAGEKKDNSEGKIVVLDTRPLQAMELLDYLEKRCIPLEVAGKYCKEVDFLLYSKQYTAIGFQNNSGGYELRNQNFKGSSSPKDISLTRGKSEDIAVFEGFFSFLSFATINKNLSAPLSKCLILNSLSFFEKSRPVMEHYSQVHLVLDRDDAGCRCTRLALSWNPGKYIDRSDFYKGRKDLNEWLIHHDQDKQLKQKHISKTNRFF